MPRKARRPHGQGSYRTRKDGRLEAAYTIGYTDNGNPKRKSKIWAKGTPDRVAADWLAQTHADFTRGVLTNPGSSTVVEYLNAYLDSHRNDLAPGSQSIYEGHIARIGKHLSKIKLSSLNIEHILKLNAAMLADGLASNTVRGAGRYLRVALDQAVYGNLINRNPARMVKPVKLRKIKPTIWDADTANQALATLEQEKHPILIYVSLALNTGCRPGELCSLTWDDLKIIDEDHALVDINKNLSWDDGLPVIKEPKTEAGKRILPISGKIVKQLEAHRVFQNNIKALFDYEDNNLIVANVPGTPGTAGTYLRENVMNGAWQRWLKTHPEIPRIRLYDLRHTNLSLLGQDGTRGEVIMYRAGHTDYAYTFSTYIHPYQSDLKDAGDRLGDILNQHQPPTPQAATTFNLELLTGEVWVTIATHKTKRSLTYIAKTTTLEDRHKLKQYQFRIKHGDTLLEIATAKPGLAPTWQAC